MLSTILLGVAASLAAEFVTWINKALSGTVIQGQGAFLFALVIAFIVATIEVVVRHFNINVSAFVAIATQIFGVAQVWFYLIAKNLGLTVQPTPSAEPIQ